MKYCILLLSIFFISCENVLPEPDCGDPPPPCDFDLHIQDDLNNDLIGSTYHIDSILLFTEFDTIDIHYHPNAMNTSNSLKFLSIYNDWIESGTMHFLRLSYLEIDTIEIYWQSSRNGCWESCKLDSVKFNNQSIETFGDKQITLIK